MVDQTFAAAYIDNDTKHRILGYKLKPFCAWHLFLLQTVDSPFLKTGEVTKFDLKVAVGACRLGYRHSKIRKAIWPILTQKQLEKHVKAFLQYIGDYLNKPEYNVIAMESLPGSKPQRQVTPPPDVIRLVYDAAHGARVSVPQAWEMPIGEAYIAQAMFFRNQGTQVDFMNQEERLFQKELIEAGVK